MLKILCFLYFQKPKGFVAEVAGRKHNRVPINFFLEEVPYSRNAIPPILTVDVSIGVAFIFFNFHQINYTRTSYVKLLKLKFDYLYSLLKINYLLNN